MEVRSGIVLLYSDNPIYSRFINQKFNFINKNYAYVSICIFSITPVVAPSKRSIIICCRKLDTRTSGGDRPITRVDAFLFFKLVGKFNDSIHILSTEAAVPNITWNPYQNKNTLYK